MPRARTSRGRHAPQLPPVKVSDAELLWITGEVAKQIAEGKPTNLTKFQRDRIFADMPGYKG